MGVKNYLIEGVSGTGKTSVCDELRRRGYHAIHGDRDLAYQGDPKTGEPTGTLREAAMMLVKDLLPPLSLEERVRRVATTQSMAHANGITAVIEPGVDDDYLEPIVTLADRDELAMRVVASLSPLNFQSGAFDERVFDYLERRDRWRRASGSGFRTTRVRFATHCRRIRRVN
jgi:predicted amidohydrolase YtcJ